MAVWKWALYVLAVVVAVGPKIWTPSFTVHEAGGIVVTGASSGIGYDAAIALASRGFTVFAGVRKSADADAITALGIKTLRPLLLDVTKAVTLQAAVAEVTAWSRESGLPLVGLVNNAGVSVSAPIESVPLAAYKDMHEVNVVGVMSVSQAFLPLIRASKGRVVNIGSVAGIVAFPVHGIYAMTKFALEAMNDAMRRELLPLGVSVSMVNPGAVSTKIVQKADTANAALANSLSPELDAVYGNLSRAYAKARNKSFASAATTEVTSAAIVDALTNAQPQARYVVATVGGLPASVYVVLTWILPANLMDRIILGAIGN